MMNPDIQNALKFIKRNYDFFKAPIEEQAKFQAWVKTSGLTPFMKSISDLLKHNFRVKDHYHLYLDALIGKERKPDDQNYLKYGDDQRLRQLLEVNPGLTQAINAIEQNWWWPIKRWNLEHKEQLEKTQRMFEIYDSPEVCKIKNNLKILLEKSEDLNERGFIKDAGVARTLARTINAALHQFIDAPETHKEEAFATFKQDSDSAIQQAKPVLEKHRGFGYLLKNLALAIATLGIGYAVAATVNKATTGNWTFFNKTDSVKKVEELESSLDDLRPPHHRNK